MTTRETLIAAGRAAQNLRTIPGEERRRALLSMADALAAAEYDIISTNESDVNRAKGKLSDVMIDRLMLSGKRISAMAEGIRDVAKLPDPLGRVIEERTLYNGLKLRKISVPLGVVAIIYESRPNVTSDAAALSVMSGNACVLRSGSDAFNTSRVITDALRRGLASAGFNPDFVSCVPDPSRESANELMTAVGLVDLLIPRGGKGLIKACLENARVPCIETGTGICHVYIDSGADLSKALDIVENAKTSRPSVCNAAEVCLVHKDIAEEFLPELENRLAGPGARHPVRLIADERAVKLLKTAVPAGPEDFDTEFLDYKLAVGIVDDVAEACRHIEEHSTHHSDAIVTEDADAADYFAAHVDSAAVYVNASTRFTDGGEFGLGCEMGISTQKLHARGPMGLNELTSYKYVVTGNGQIR
ncbi:MAG: glutamate-5-semialdehyde dehydrogenase [Clostridia bacterium]|nr:glutamate-5-semialdehyde dehydrogenase [Clostridia bacterium]